MRNFILTVLIAFDFMATAFAQSLPVDAGTGKITYLEVVDATGVKPADLTKVVKDWATKQGFTVKGTEKTSLSQKCAPKLPISLPLTDEHLPSLYLPFSNAMITHFYVWFRYPSSLTSTKQV